MADAHSFSDERFMSAREKEKVLLAWKRFLRSGCSKSLFTKDLYRHLIQHCSFIAHYDRHGFYAFYFDRITAELFRLLDQFDPQKPGVSAEYGTIHWLSKYNTGADLNRAMREETGPYVDELRQRFQELQRQCAISAANSTLARYGMIAVPAPTAAPMEPITTQIGDRSSTVSIQPRLFCE